MTIKMVGIAKFFLLNGWGQGQAGPTPPSHGKKWLQRDSKNSNFMTNEGSKSDFLTKEGTELYA